jgi:hypothetical protein
VGILIENKKKEVGMKNKYEIFTVPAYNGNAYIMETAGNGGCEFLWTAPLFQDDTVDNTQWGPVEDDEIVNTVLDSNEKIVLKEIAVADFNKLVGIN